MANQERDLPNLYIEGGAERESYTRPVRVDLPPPPERDRTDHAAKLKQGLDAAFASGRQLVRTGQNELEPRDRGFYLDVLIQDPDSNVLESLEDRRQGFELLAARRRDEGGSVIATLFIPEQRANALTKKVEAYASEDTRSGRPRYEPMVARIEEVSVATLRSLFTDPSHLFPEADEQMWWEVWLRPSSVSVFERVTARMQIPTREHALTFPERRVVLARGTPTELSEVLFQSAAIAELRKAKDAPSAFLEMGPQEQGAWVEDLRERLEGPVGDEVAICLLDTGIAGEHPLLRPASAPTDRHSYHPDWGAHDSNGHGTGMAGLALYGDLTEALNGRRAVTLTHRLESVKILPDAGANEPDLYGAITADGVAQAEVAAPDRKRVVCLAVTSDHETGAGQPSSWSAAVDQLSFGEMDWRRLIVVAAGNIRGPIAATDYPGRNDVEPIENPGQAWNAITVGAYTEKCNIVDVDIQDAEVVAQPGGLAPTSRTAVSWSPAWLNKPDVVMEGGNRLIDGEDAVGHDDLCLLTTSRHVTLAPFRAFGDTSAAAALVARIAAQISAEQPQLWPETVRALVIHSAEWTPEMLRPLGPQPVLSEKRLLLRRFGYGVPDLTRAIRSASNDLNLVIQEQIKPYEVAGSGRPRTKDMHLHRLPWPKDVLLALGEEPVEMRVTLSYFIEPNPGERGRTRRHQYPSHGLRFEVKRVFESDDEFRARLNREARTDEYKGATLTDADRWFLGTRLRHTGSVHSDLWRGIATDLAQRDAIGVTPVGGWWKENRSLERWDRAVPYSLVVSIRAREAEVDLYTPIRTAIETPVEITGP